MKKALFIACALGIIHAPNARAGFVGTLEFTPLGCEVQNLCTLKYDFGFLDPKGGGWQTNAGDKTDGASIPGWAQAIIGGMFDEQFIKAAVIHDHYCNRHVRSWRATHQMFYDALLSSGVPLAKAQIMYFAVYSGGPRWTELVKGDACPIGKMCLSSKSMMADPSVHMMEQEGSRYLVREEQYATEKFERHMAMAHAMMAEMGDKVTIKDLEKLAETLDPADVFYQTGDYAAGQK